MNNTFKTVCLAAILITTLLAGSCQRMEVVEDSIPGIQYKVTSVDMGRTVHSKSGLSYFEGSEIPFSFCSYEGIGSVTLAADQSETRGTLYNEGDELSSFKACVYNGDKELFYDKEITWNGSMWKDKDNTSWPYGESLRFLAYANEPASGFELNSYPTLTEMNITVDKNPANQKDILIGYYCGTGNPKGTADIQFQHPMTAVAFKLGEVTVPDIESVVVKSITLKGLARNAQFTTPASVNDAEATWTVAESDPYTLAPTQKESTSNAGLTVAEDGTVGDTFILIPQDLYEHHVRAEIVLGLKKGTTTTTYSLFAQFENGCWSKGNTNVYTIGYDEHLSDFVFKVDNNVVLFNSSDSQSKTFKVTSSRYNGYKSSPGRENENFNIDYSIDGGQNWAEFDASAQANAGLTMTKSAPSDYVYTVTLKSKAKTSMVLPKNRWADDATVASDWDLSKCEVGGEEYRPSNPQNTANTYIVKHAGTYRFPCVYGNSVKNGSATDAGYQSSVKGPSVLDHLINALGGPISTAYILDDVKDMDYFKDKDYFHPRAALLWTDAKDSDGNVVVKNVALNDADDPENAYISFETSDKSALVHGNAVIILYNDKDDNGIYEPQIPVDKTTETALLAKDIVLWSWQIWITDADLGADNAIEIGSTRDGGGSARLMSRFLGWNDGTTDVTRYSANVADDSFRKFQLRVTQNYTGNQIVINVLQEDLYNYAKGSVPYYQYGRFAPTFGYYTGVNTAKAFYKADGTKASLSTLTGNMIDDPVFYFNSKGTPNTLEQAKTDVRNVIKLPQVFILASPMERSFSNLWSLDNSGSDVMVQTVKTVYDPSPYGYKIPNFGLLMTCLSQNKFVDALPGGSKKGRIYYNNEQNTIVYLPHTGLRNYDMAAGNTSSANFMTSSVCKTQYDYNQVYIAVLSSGDSDYGKFKRSASYLAKGCAAPILPILDE